MNNSTTPTPDPWARIRCPSDERLAELELVVKMHGAGGGTYHLVTADRDFQGRAICGTVMRGTAIEITDPVRRSRAAVCQRCVAKAARS
jgi:hypothetical protein